MGKIKFIMIFNALIVGLFAFSQTAETGQKKSADAYPMLTAIVFEEEAAYSEVVYPYDGTFQFVFLNGKKSVFTDEIFNTIEKNRKKEERAELYLTPHCKVIILSEKEIRSPEFVPFERQYVFE
jgi:hypothetical protein